MTFSITDLIYSAAIVTGLLLALTLLNKRGQGQLGNRYLAAGISLYALVLVELIFYKQGFYQSFPMALGWLLPSYLLIAPMLDRYASLLCSEPVEQGFKHWLPFYLACALITPIFFLTDADRSALVNEQLTEPVSPMLMLVGFNLFIYSLLPLLQAPYYLHQNWQKFQRFDKRLQDNYSDIEHRKANGFRYFLIALSGVWLLHLLEMGSGLTSEHNGINYAAIGISGLLIFACYWALNNNPVEFFDDPEQTQKSKAIAENNQAISETNKHHQAQPSPHSDNTKTSAKYQHSGLDQALSEQLAQELIQQIKHQQLYTKPDINLNQLAELLGITRNMLSQILNETLRTNFYGFINELRIDRAKGLLQSQPESTILDVAMEVGFNSKSAFYGAFKKQTGQTPKDYKLEQLH